MALNGHLEVVQYLRTLGISLSAYTCANAALNGHLELLKWARTHQCPLNGHPKILKWARANQCPWDKWTCSSAASNGHLELEKNGPGPISAHGMDGNVAELLPMAILNC